MSERQTITSKAIKKETESTKEFVLSRDKIPLPSSGGDVDFENASGYAVDVNFTTGTAVPDKLSIPDGQTETSNVTRPANYTVSASSNMTVQPVNGEIVIETQA
jgi:hypothetical protein